MPLMLFEEAQMLAVGVFGPDHWLVVASTRDSGLAARHLGDAATADAFYRDAYAKSSELLGEAHPETQYIASLIAELFNASQAFEEAKSMKEVHHSELRIRDGCCAQSDDGIEGK